MLIYLKLTDFVFSLITGGEFIRIQTFLWEFRLTIGNVLLV